VVIDGCGARIQIRIMKTALVIVELPKTNDTSADRTNWLDFLAHMQRAGEPPKNTNRLTGNVWQIPLDNGLPFLSVLFQSAEDSKTSIRSLILDEPPEWIKHPPAS
jgi:hypothetical protein